MRCVKCGNSRIKTCNVRSRVDGIVKRRRECESCGERWTTMEISAAELEELRALRDKKEEKIVNPEVMEFL
jgi:transcriptional regulator NrdR family protein